MLLPSKQPVFESGNFDGYTEDDVYKETEEQLKKFIVDYTEAKRVAPKGAEGYGLTNPIDLYRLLNKYDITEQWQLEKALYDPDNWNGKKLSNAHRKYLTENWFKDKGTFRTKVEPGQVRTENYLNPQDVNFSKSLNQAFSAAKRRKILIERNLQETLSEVPTFVIEDSNTSTFLIPQPAKPKSIVDEKVRKAGALLSTVGSPTALLETQKVNGKNKLDTKVSDPVTTGTLNLVPSINMMSFEKGTGEPLDIDSMLRSDKPDLDLTKYNEEYHVAGAVKQPPFLAEWKEAKNAILSEAFTKISTNEYTINDLDKAGMALDSVYSTMLDKYGLEWSEKRKKIITDEKLWLNQADRTRIWGENIPRVPVGVAQNIVSFFETITGAMNPEEANLLEDYINIKEALRTIKSRYKDDNRIVLKENLDFFGYTGQLGYNVMQGAFDFLTQYDVHKGPYDNIKHVFSVQSEHKVKEALASIAHLTNIGEEDYNYIQDTMKSWSERGLTIGYGVGSIMAELATTFKVGTSIVKAGTRSLRMSPKIIEATEKILSGPKADKVANFLQKPAQWLAKTTGIKNWNRPIAINDKFVPSLYQTLGYPMDHILGFALGSVLSSIYDMEPNMSTETLVEAGMNGALLGAGNVLFGYALGSVGRNLPLTSKWIQKNYPYETAAMLSQKLATTGYLLGTFPAAPLSMTLSRATFHSEVPITWDDILQDAIMNTVLSLGGSRQIMLGKSSLSNIKKRADYLNILAKPSVAKIEIDQVEPSGPASYIYEGRSIGDYLQGLVGKSEGQIKLSEIVETLNKRGSIDKYFGNQPKGIRAKKLFKKLVDSYIKDDAYIEVRTINQKENEVILGRHKSELQEGDSAHIAIQQKRGRYRRKLASEFANDETLIKVLSHELGHHAWERKTVDDNDRMTVSFLAAKVRDNYLKNPEILDPDLAIAVEASGLDGKNKVNESEFFAYLVNIDNGEFRNFVKSNLSPREYNSLWKIIDKVVPSPESARTTLERAPVPREPTEHNILVSGLDKKLDYERVPEELQKVHDTYRKLVSEKGYPFLAQRSILDFAQRLPEKDRTNAKAIQDIIEKETQNFSKLIETDEGRTKVEQTQKELLGEFYRSRVEPFIIDKDYAERTELDESELDKDQEFYALGIHRVNFESLARLSGFLSVEDAILQLKKASSRKEAGAIIYKGIKKRFEVEHKREPNETERIGLLRQAVRKANQWSNTIPIQNLHLDLTRKEIVPIGREAADGVEVPTVRGKPSFLFEFNDYIVKKINSLPWISDATKKFVSELMGSRKIGQIASVTRENTYSLYEEVDGVIQEVTRTVSVNDHKMNPIRLKNNIDLIAEYGFPFPKTEGMVILLSDAIKNLKDDEKMRIASDLFSYGLARYLEKQIPELSPYIGEIMKEINVHETLRTEKLTRNTRERSFKEIHKDNKELLDAIESKRELLVNTLESYLEPLTYRIDISPTKLLVNAIYDVYNFAFDSEAKGRGSSSSTVPKLMGKYLNFFLNPSPLQLKETRELAYFIEGMIRDDGTYSSEVLGRYNMEYDTSRDQVDGTMAIIHHDLVPKDRWHASRFSKDYMDSGTFNSSRVQDLLNDILEAETGVRNSKFISWSMDKDNVLMHKSMSYAFEGGKDSESDARTTELINKWTEQATFVTFSSAIKNGKFIKPSERFIEELGLKVLINGEGDIVQATDIKTGKEGPELVKKAKEWLTDQIFVKGNIPKVIKFRVPVTGEQGLKFISSVHQSKNIEHGAVNYVLEKTLQSLPGSRFWEGETGKRAYKAHQAVQNNMVNKARELADTYSTALTAIAKINHELLVSKKRIRLNNKEKRSLGFLFEMLVDSIERNELQAFPQFRAMISLDKAELINQLKAMYTYDKEGNPIASSKKSNLVKLNILFPDLLVTHTIAQEARGSYISHLFLKELDHLIKGRTSGMNLTYVPMLEGESAINRMIQLELRLYSESLIDKGIDEKLALKLYQKKKLELEDRRRKLVEAYIDKETGLPIDGSPLLYIGVDDYIELSRYIHTKKSGRQLDSLAFAPTLGTRTPADGPDSMSDYVIAGVMVGKGIVSINGLTAVKVRSMDLDKDSFSIRIPDKIIPFELFRDLHDHYSTTGARHGSYIEPMQEYARNLKPDQVTEYIQDTYEIGEDRVILTNSHKAYDETLDATNDMGGTVGIRNKLVTLIRDILEKKGIDPEYVEKNEVTKLRVILRGERARIVLHIPLRGKEAAEFDAKTQLAINKAVDAYDDRVTNPLEFMTGYIKRTPNPVAEIGRETILATVHEALSSSPLSELTDYLGNYGKKLALSQSTKGKEYFSRIKEAISKFGNSILFATKDIAPVIYTELLARRYSNLNDRLKKGYSKIEGSQKVISDLNQLHYTLYSVLSFQGRVKRSGSRIVEIVEEAGDLSDVNIYTESKQAQKVLGDLLMTIGKKYKTESGYETDPSLDAFALTALSELMARQSLKKLPFIISKGKDGEIVYNNGEIIRKTKDEVKSVAIPDLIDDNGNLTVNWLTSADIRNIAWHNIIQFDKNITAEQRAKIVAKALRNYVNKVARNTEDRNKLFTLAVLLEPETRERQTTKGSFLFKRKDNISDYETSRILEYVTEAFPDKKPSVAKELLAMSYRMSQTRYSMEQLLKYAKLYGMDLAMPNGEKFDTHLYRQMNKVAVEDLKLTNENFLKVSPDTEVNDFIAKSNIMQKLLGAKNARNLSLYEEFKEKTLIDITNEDYSKLYDLVEPVLKERIRKIEELNGVTRGSLDNLLKALTPESMASMDIKYKEVYGDIGSSFIKLIAMDNIADALHQAEKLPLMKKMQKVLMNFSLVNSTMVSQIYSRLSDRTNYIHLDPNYPIIHETRFINGKEVKESRRAVTVFDMINHGTMLQVFGGTLPKHLVNLLIPSSEISLMKDVLVTQINELRKKISGLSLAKDSKTLEEFMKDESLQVELQKLQFFSEMQARKTLKNTVKYISEERDSGEYPIENQENIRNLVKDNIKTDKVDQVVEYIILKSYLNQFNNVLGGISSLIKDIQNHMQDHGATVQLRETRKYLYHMRKRLASKRIDKVLDLLRGTNISDQELLELVRSTSDRWNEKTPRGQQGMYFKYLKETGRKWDTFKSTYIDDRKSRKGKDGNYTYVKNATVFNVVYQAIKTGYILDKKPNKKKIYDRLYNNAYTHLADPVSAEDRISKEQFLELYKDAMNAFKLLKSKGLIFYNLAKDIGIPEYQRSYFKWDKDTRKKLLNKAKSIVISRLESLANELSTEKRVIEITDGDKLFDTNALSNESARKKVIDILARINPMFEYNKDIEGNDLGYQLFDYRTKNLADNMKQEIGYIYGQVEQAMRAEYNSNPDSDPYARHIALGELSKIKSKETIFAEPVDITSLPRKGAVTSTTQLEPGIPLEIRLSPKVSNKSLYGNYVGIRSRLLAMIDEQGNLVTIPLDYIDSMLKGKSFGMLNTAYHKHVQKEYKKLANKIVSNLGLSKVKQLIQNLDTNVNSGLKQALVEWARNNNRKLSAMMYMGGNQITLAAASIAAGIITMDPGVAAVGMFQAVKSYGSKIGGKLLAQNIFGNSGWGSVVPTHSVAQWISGVGLGSVVQQSINLYRGLVAPEGWSKERSIGAATVASATEGTMLKDLLNTDVIADDIRTGNLAEAVGNIGKTVVDTFGYKTAKEILEKANEYIAKHGNMHVSSAIDSIKKYLDSISSNLTVVPTGQRVRKVTFTNEQGEKRKRFVTSYSNLNLFYKGKSIREWEEHKASIADLLIRAVSLNGWVQYMEVLSAEGAFRKARLQIMDYVNRRKANFGNYEISEYAMDQLERSIVKKSIGDYGRTPYNDTPEGRFLTMFGNFGKESAMEQTRYWLKRRQLYSELRKNILASSDQGLKIYAQKFGGLSGLINPPDIDIGQFFLSAPRTLNRIVHASIGHIAKKSIPRIVTYYLANLIPQINLAAIIGSINQFIYELNDDDVSGEIINSVFNVGNTIGIQSINILTGLLNFVMGSTAKADEETNVGISASSAKSMYKQISKIPQTSLQSIGGGYGISLAGDILGGLALMGLKHIYDTEVSPLDYRPEVAAEAMEEIMKEKAKSLTQIVAPLWGNIIWGTEKMVTEAEKKASPRGSKYIHID